MTTAVLRGDVANPARGTVSTACAVVTLWSSALPTNPVSFGERRGWLRSQRYCGASLCVASVMTPRSWKSLCRDPRPAACALCPWRAPSDRVHAPHAAQKFGHGGAAVRCVGLGARPGWCSIRFTLTRLNARSTSCEHFRLTRSPWCSAVTPPPPVRATWPTRAVTIDYCRAPACFPRRVVERSARRWLRGPRNSRRGAL